MHKAAAALIALALAGPAAADSDWRVSFVPGVTDRDGNVLHVTEIRQFAVWGSPPVLYAAAGNWLGTGSAMILRQDGPDEPWRLEVDFGAFCPQPGCVDTTAALRSIQWKKTETGQPVNVWTLVASVWPGSVKKQRIYTRNNTDSAWYETVLADNNSGHVRAFATHEDKAANKFWGFAAGKPAIFRGQLSDNRGKGQNIIKWQAGLDAAEADFTNFVDPACAATRVLGLAEAHGKMFAAICYSIFERVDGPQGDCGPKEVAGQGNQCSPRWVKFWAEPSPGHGEGLRGLTTVTYGGKDYLLMASESAIAKVWELDPDTANAKIELDINASLAGHWGVDTGYVIAGYNSPMELAAGAGRVIGMEVGLGAVDKHPPPGHAEVYAEHEQSAATDHQLGADVATQSTNYAPWEADGWFYLRNGPAAYTLHHIPPITNRPMLSVRASIASPWNDGFTYFGGHDMNSSPSWTPCKAPPCTFPPLVPMPSPDTGWIVKGKVQ